MKSRGYLLLGSALAVFGCGGGSLEAGDGEEPGGENTGLALQAAVEADSQIDVASVRYRIDRVACADGDVFEPLSREIQVQLLPILLTSGASQHQAADHFEVLPAGCYDVSATPLAADASESADCGAARKNGVQVIDGETTEVLLVSQCTGPEVGALDAGLAFNQPPELQSLTFTPSKVIAAGGKTTVCATAADPDGDLLQVEWTQLQAEGSAAGTVVISVQENQENASGSPQCADITVNEAGSYKFEVRIFDAIRDENGNLIRIESALAEHGSQKSSNDSLKFPVYALAAAAAPEESGEEPGEEPGEPPAIEPGEQPGEPVVTALPDQSGSEGDDKGKEP